MSLETEDQNAPDQAAEISQSQKNLKISYTREFLLAFSVLDECKRLPSGFDQSILSEFEDASLDRQRSSGGLSMHNFRRNEYGSSPPTRGDSSGYPRGIQGKWESRSYGRSDRDSDSQSDLDPDPGRRHSNQSRKYWQGSEHDGLLGSGFFPRPSAPGFSAPKFRPNENYQLNRSNEPYHPPRPYKSVPHSRRDTTDSYNDETFGSSEVTSEDRVEEERKRRASFELMRKEQHKAFQDKQKSNADKQKDEFDITSLLDDPKDVKKLVNRGNESVESVTVQDLSNDPERSSLAAHGSASSRPLIPPGFASAIMDRNVVTKLSHALEDGLTESGAGTLDPRSNNLLNGKSDCQEEKASYKQISSKEQHESAETLGVSVNNEDVRHNVEANGNKRVNEFSSDKSNSILEKLFGNALTLNSGSPANHTEHHDNNGDETCSANTFQSSKFAQFFNEEKKLVDDSSSQGPSDLFSLIVGGEKGRMLVPDLKTSNHLQLEFPFENSCVAERHVASNVSSMTPVNSEHLYKGGEPEIVSAVLTCEDLEQSILSEIGENDSAVKRSIPDAVLDAKINHSSAKIDDHASQHLLALLQKGTCQNNITLSPITDVKSSEEVHTTEADGSVLDKKGQTNSEETSSLSETVTLEKFFGAAFMKELQSVGAPVSVQRGSVGSLAIDISEPLRFPFPIADNGIPPIKGEVGSNRYASDDLSSKQMQESKLNMLEVQWPCLCASQAELDSSQLRGEVSKLSGFDGHADIRLPEEENLIMDGDPLQNFIASGNSIKTELFSSEAPIDVADEAAGINHSLRGRRPIVGGQVGSHHLSAPYDLRELDIPYQNLIVQQSSPPFHQSQLNHLGIMLNSLDSHPTRSNSHMKLVAPEGVIHRDTPPNHQFPGNLLRPPFQYPSSGSPGFDPSHYSLLPQMHVPGNFPPAHLARGFSGGEPLCTQPNNGFIQELSQMQGFQIAHQQNTFGGQGMSVPAPEVALGRNHPEALQRLIEMELRSKSKQIRPFAGSSQGLYGPELDMGFRYR